MTRGSWIDPKWRRYSCQQGNDVFHEGYWVCYHLFGCLSIREKPTEDLAAAAWPRGIQRRAHEVSGSLDTLLFWTRAGYLLDNGIMTKSFLSGDPRILRLTKSCSLLPDLIATARESQRACLRAFPTHPLPPRFCSSPPLRKKKSRKRTLEISIPRNKKWWIYITYSLTNSPTLSAQALHSTAAVAQGSQTSPRVREQINAFLSPSTRRSPVLGPRGVGAADVGRSGSSWFASSYGFLGIPFPSPGAPYVSRLWVPITVIFLALSNQDFIERAMGRPFTGTAKGENWTALEGSVGDHVYLVTRWWMRTRASALASSCPGQEWLPFPNGKKVFGLGATCDERRENWPPYSMLETDWMIDRLFTSNLEGSNFFGSGNKSGLWWMFRNRGITFHPLGMR